MHVLHIINSLDVGGAETALVNLVAAGPDRHRHTVISLTGEGPLAERLRRMRAEVVPLDFRNAWLAPARFTALVGTVRRTKPDVVQTWMYHADILGGLARLVAGIDAPLVWGVRLSEPRAAGLKRSTLLAIRLAGMLSRFLPDAIVANAARSIEMHGRFGYAMRKFRVVANGFDVERFRPDPARRAAQRARAALAEADIVAGLVGRFSHQKNQIGFLEACGEAAKSVPGLRPVLCGRGIGEGNRRLCRVVAGADLGRRALLFPERPDPENVYALLDFYVSASTSEGFPNVVAEAMASGVPCIATDVGNCRELIGDTGVVVPAGDPAALAQAIERMAAMPAAERRAMGEAARQRIVGSYSLERTLAGFEAVWREVREARH